MLAVSVSAETPTRIALSSIKIDNFGVVDANYFRGSAPPDGEYPKLGALGVKMVIDDTSLDLLQGAEVDFVEDLVGSAFQVRNPNATSSCGCGSSFSVA